MNDGDDGTNAPCASPDARISKAFSTATTAIIDKTGTRSRRTEFRIVRLAYLEARTCGGAFSTSRAMQP